MTDEQRERTVVLLYERTKGTRFARERGLRLVANILRSLGFVMYKSAVSAAQFLRHRTTDKLLEESHDRKFFSWTPLGASTYEALARKWSTEAAPASAEPRTDAEAATEDQDKVQLRLTREQKHALLRELQQASTDGYIERQQALALAQAFVERILHLRITAQRAAALLGNSFTRARSFRDRDAHLDPHVRRGHYHITQAGEDFLHAADEGEQQLHPAPTPIAPVPLDPPADAGAALQRFIELLPRLEAVMPLLERLAVITQLDPEAEASAHLIQARICYERLHPDSQITIEVQRNDTWGNHYGVETISGNMPVPPLDMARSRVKRSK